MNTSKADLVIIGGGPGGYTAAFYAADRGLSVTLIERHKSLGGVCLNVGCIPSKTLLHLASFKEKANKFKEHGIIFDQIRIDLDKIRNFKNSVIDKMRMGLNQLSKNRNIRLIRGEASFKDSHTLQVEQQQRGKQIISFAHAIIATGSKPIVPEAFKLNSKRLIDSTDALEINDIPKELLIVGGGVIGLEMGQVYSSFGSKVTIIEALDDIGGGVDEDLLRVLKKKLSTCFHEIHVKSLVTKIVDKGDFLEVHYKKEGNVFQKNFDKVLLSIGRKPNADHLKLENTKAQKDSKGFIKVDAQMKTANSHIFAIGDVIGNPMLAHKASREGHIAVEVILGEKAIWDHRGIPSVIYTDPELAWVGLSENEAKEKNLNYKIGRFPWAASGRASAVSANDGLTKILFDPKTEKVLGVGIVGYNAGELIAEGCLALEMGAVIADITNTIHAHPTLAETFMESAESLHGMATHIFAKKK